MTAYVCAEDMTVQSDKLDDFYDVRRPIAGYDEYYSSRKFSHYRLVSMESSNSYLFMTLAGKYVPPDLSYFPDDFFNAQYLLDDNEEFK